jgi:hypothetical protein
MALGIYLAHERFTPEKNSSAVEQPEAARAGTAKGRTYHVALESNGEIQVLDIWETQEDFDAFGPRLMPILTELGVGLKEPMVASVHNVYWLGTRVDSEGVHRAHRACLRLSSER